MMQPTSDQWRKLYALAGQIHDMAPWTWMEEVDIFGVTDPDSGATGFVSVMGSAGEHFGIAVYRGAEALHQFMYIQESAEEFGPDVALEILEVSQLQLSFEDREFVDKEDRAVIKELGLKFRGRNAWPMFRGTEPGWLPWFISAEEAQYLTVVLEQLVEVAPRLRSPNTFFDMLDEQRLLVRTAHKADQKLIWEDKIVHVEFTEPETTPAAIDEALFTNFQKLPAKKMTIEVDLFNSMMPTLNEQKRPFMPYMLMLVDAKSGMIIGQSLLKPEPDLDSIWANSANSLMGQCVAALGARPATIHVSNEYLHELLKQFAKRSGIKIVLRDELPAFEEAVMSMMGMFGGFGF